MPADETNVTVTLGEAARRLECSEATVRRYCADGTLAYRRTGGGHRRIFERSIDELLSAADSGPEAA